MFQFTEVTGAVYVMAHELPLKLVTHTLTSPLHNRLFPHTVFMLVPLTNVGCTAILPLHSRLVEFTVLILVHDTKVSCTAIFQLHKSELEFTVFIFVQLTNVSCFQDIVEAYQSYVLTLALVIHESKASS